MFKLPEMEPRGTLGKDMTTPTIYPLICLSTCGKPTAIIIIAIITMIIIIVVTVTNAYGAFIRHYFKHFT